MLVNDKNLQKQRKRNTHHTIKFNSQNHTPSIFND